MIPDMETVAELVISAARQELLPRFGRVSTQRKVDGSLVSQADLAVQEKLGASLKQHWPDFVLLSEEQSDAERHSALQHLSTGVWCLDPLDGTSNFVAGVPYYAISLAFLKENRVEAGLVYDPQRDECFTAQRGQGARLNGQPLPALPQPEKLHQALALVDFKRLPTAMRQQLVTRPPYKSQRSFGAVALDWCWLAAGRVHLYVHGQQNLWDYAAGQLVLTEAGGQASTLEGEEVFRPDLLARSSVAALDPTLFAAWREWLLTKE